jgi:hypothetical protein
LKWSAREVSESSKLREIEKGDFAGDISICSLNNFLQSVLVYLRGVSLAFSEEGQRLFLADVFEANARFVV